MHRREVKFLFLPTFCSAQTGAPSQGVETGKHLFSLLIYYEFYALYSLTPNKNSTVIYSVKWRLIFLIACLQRQEPRRSLLFSPHLRFVGWMVGGGVMCGVQAGHNQPKDTSNWHIKHSCMALPPSLKFTSKWTQPPSSSIAHRLLTKKKSKNFRSNLNLFCAYFGATSTRACPGHFSSWLSLHMVFLWGVTSDSFRHLLVLWNFSQLLGSHLLSESEKNIFTMSEVW